MTLEKKYLYVTSIGIGLILTLIFLGILLESLFVMCLSIIPGIIGILLQIKLDRENRKITEKVTLKITVS